MAKLVQCIVCEQKFRFKEGKKFCSGKCRAKYNRELKKKEFQKLENQLSEKQKPQENEPAQKIEPKIDNAEIQKLKDKILEIEKENSELKSEIQKIKDKAEAQIDKLKLEKEKINEKLKEAKAPPANLKSRLIIFKCYLELIKRIEYRLKKDDRIDKNKYQITSFKETRLDRFKNTIEHANAEQIFYSHYEYEGKGDDTSNSIKNRLGLLERFTRDLFDWNYKENDRVVYKYNKLELSECIGDCGIMNYAKNDAELFGKYYDLPKNS